MKYAIALFITAVMYGQDNHQINKNIRALSRTEAKTAWATVNFLAPADLPPVTDGGLPVEVQANDSGIKVAMVYRQPGQYLFEGIRCNNGQKVEIDEFQIEPGYELYTNSEVVYDGQMFEQGLRRFGRFCSMNLYRIYGGKIERSEVNLDQWNDEAPKPQVKGEVVNGRFYVLTFDTLPTEAVVILGRNMIGKIKPGISGSLVAFEEPRFPNRKSITVTICTRKGCGSSAYAPKEQAVDAIDPGKGE